MKRDCNWGSCPKRYVGWAEKDDMQCGWTYVCGKNGRPCNPDYCLGPDENEKGDENEREVV